MRIIILEDSEIELNNLTKELTDWSIVSGVDIFITTFSSGEDFFSKTNINSLNTDLFILDVAMKKMSGIDVAKKLRTSNYNGDIIFFYSI